MTQSYSSYRNLPPLGGICNFEEAAKKGLTVKECVARLKRFHYAGKRLHGIFTAQITSEPIYELKSAFSLHAYLCAEIVTSLRDRISEMREPPLGLDKIPDPHLEIYFDEIRSAPTTEERLTALYQKAIPELSRAMARHLEDTNPLADYPSTRALKFARQDLLQMENFGREAVASLVAEDCRSRAEPWLDRLDEYLQAAGGLDGISPTENTLKERCHSRKPWRYDPRPRRDSRFPDPYNMAVNAEAFLYDDSFSAEPKTLMMFFKRLREIDVPEMMASIIVETPDRSWLYYRDMTRQLWDEARHAMMGEVGFAQLGVDWRHAMVNFTWSLALNTQLTPLERHAVLYFIEQGLMAKTGKRFEWEVAQASGNPLSALFQDYDWADEVLHARIGRDWYLSQMTDPQQAVAYGDRCWSKVLMDWERWQKDGLTEHRNWWPDLYREACRRRQVEPDEAVLNYRVSYREVRADLKTISASG